jgi:hypothetical protein
MSTIAEMVDELIAAGTPPGIAASIVTQAFAAGAQSIRPQTSTDVTRQSRLEKDRIRQQMRRDNLRKSTDVQGNPQTSVDVSLSKSKSLEKREADGADVRVTWRPPDVDWNDAVAKLGLQAAESELVKFRERPGSMSRILPDWRVWVQRAVDYLAKNKPAAAPILPTKTDAAFDWDSVVKTWHRTGYWSAQAGPDPESPACRCPRDILENHAILEMKAAE